MPVAAGRIAGMLGLSGTEEPRPSDRKGGGLKAGQPLGAVEPLFPRIEKKETLVSEPSNPAPPTGAATPSAPPVTSEIDISEFARVELKVALVTAAEKIAGSKKLLKLEVDLGTEKRQIVSGIADAYAPESLVGKKVALVSNLKPAKLMGVESNGMVLAASIDGRAVLCTFDADVPPGTRIK
jgi:methionyl-tRNA synthetase